MKPLSYVLCYACLMHYLAFAATKMYGEWTVPVPLFLAISLLAFVCVMIAVAMSRKADREED